MGKVDRKYKNRLKSQTNTFRRGHEGLAEWMFDQEL